MYDMYPDWGPAKHRDEPTDAVDQRDGATQRPDDN